MIENNNRGEDNENGGFNAWYRSNSKYVFIGALCMVIGLNLPYIAANTAVRFALCMIGSVALTLPCAIPLYLEAREEGRVIWSARHTIALAMFIILTALSAVNGFMLW